MRVALVVAGVLVIAAGAVWSEEQWPLRLEQVWETPEKGEAVFAEGFPPPEIKAAFADTSIPEEDKEWVLNNIRLWAARKTKKLWLDDGSTMGLPVVKPGDKVRTLTVFPSRNKKYWLVRAMRFEGPEIPPKPSFQVSPETARDPKYWEEVNAWERAACLQKAHWREVFMDVEGRIYWEKEFGPYDTHLEGSYLGNVEAYVSDDGGTVVKRGGSKYSTFCDRAGNCTIAEATASFSSYAQLSSDGSTLVILHAGHRYRVSGGFSPPMSCVAAYDRSGGEVCL